MRVAVVVLVAGCSFASARSRTHRTSCSGDYGAPVADSIIAFASAGVAAFDPAVPHPHADHVQTTVAIALATWVVFTASAVYGYALVDSQRCPAKAAG